METQKNFGLQPASSTYSLITADWNNQGGESRHDRSRQCIRRKSDPGCYPYTATKSKSEEKRPAQESIFARIVTTEETSDWMTSRQENQFISLISQEDFFTLTGSNRVCTRIIYMVREPHLVRPHHALGKSTIALSQGTPFTERLSLELSSCQEQLKVAAAVVIAVENRNKLERSAVVDSQTSSYIRHTIKTVPVFSDREYKLKLPLSYLASSEKTSKKESNSSMSVPTIFCEITMVIHPSGANIPTGPFLIGDDTAIRLDPKGQLVAKKKKVIDDSCFLKNLKFAGSCQYNGDNYVHLNPSYLRLFNKQVKREHPFLLCKIGSYHYFCVVAVTGDIVGDSFEMNELCPSKDQKYSITLCDDFTLQDAIRCVVELKWHRQPFSIKLSQKDIKKKTTEALKQVPLEEGREFLIPLFFCEDTFAVVRGQIIEVEGKQSSEPGKPLQIVEGTDLQLRADDLVLLQGGDCKESKKEQTVARLTHGLAGMDEIASKIYDTIICPLEAFINNTCSDFERGLLLCGPPGVGKSALSTNLINLLKTSPFKCEVALVGHNFLGNSAANTRVNVLSLQSEANGCEDGRVLVVYMDEFDSLIMAGDSDGSLSDVKMAFKSELQKLMSDGPKNIFFIATSNKDKDDFDEALTRSGRLGVVISLDKPDLEQREAILKSAFEKTGYNYGNVDVGDLARRTGQKKSSDIEALVRNITLKASLRGEGAGGSLLDSDVESAFIDPNDTSMSLKQVLNQFSDKSKREDLLASEKEALQKTEKAINRVRSTMGKHTVVLVQADEARAEVICYHILQKAGTASLSTPSLNQQLPPFSDFKIVPRKTTEILKQSISAINSIEIGKRTLLMVNGVDKLLQSTEKFVKHTEVGDAWREVERSDNSCAALVMVDSGGESAGRLEFIKELLNLSWIGKVVRVQSTPQEEDYGKVLDKYGVSGADKKAILKIVSASGLEISRFSHLLDLYVQTGGDSGDPVCDIEEIKESIRNNAVEKSSMFT